MLCLWLCAKFQLCPNIKVPVVFSSTDMNRLSLVNGRIAQVFGADLFQVEKDEQTGQIFLHIKEDVTPPDSMSMAFVTDDGITQDIEVSFEEGIATPVIFQAEQLRESLFDRAKNFFHDILSGQVEPYVRQESGQDKIFDWGKAVFQHRYVSDDLSVEVYHVYGQNCRCIYTLKPQLFLGPGVYGVYLPEKILKGKKPITVYILCG